MKPARDTGAGFCAEGLCAGRPARTGVLARGRTQLPKSCFFPVIYSSATAPTRPQWNAPGQKSASARLQSRVGYALRRLRASAIFCCRGGESSGCSMCNFLASRACSPHHRAINLESQLRRVFCSPDWRRDHRNGGVGFSAFHRGCLAAQYHQNLWLDADCIRRQAIGAGMRPDRSLHASRALPR